MKQLVTIMLALLAITCQAIAQEKQDEHLLDGTSMDYYYQNGNGLHVEFINGQYKSKWIAGPNTGLEYLEDYRSRKIGPKMYMVNIMFVDSKNFITIVFNFNQNVISTSALIAPGTDEEIIFFEAGIIENLNLHEN
jgi:hypothetical protein